jgi:hypothetical protein
MRANKNTPAGEKSASTDKETPDATRTPTGGLEDVYAAVELPEYRTPSSIDVAGYAYDDEEGSVELLIGGPASTTLVLSPAEAQALADAIATAAEEADREVEV